MSFIFGSHFARRKKIMSNVHETVNFVLMEDDSSKSYGSSKKKYAKTDGSQCKKYKNHFPQ